jgi:hypothetical protein
MGPGDRHIFSLALVFHLLNLSCVLIKVIVMLCDQRMVINKQTKYRIHDQHKSISINRPSTFLDGFSYYLKKLVKHKSVTERMVLKNLSYNWSTGAG